MTRVTRGFVAKKRRKKVLKLASGFTGANNRLYRTAQQRTLRALSNAYRDRRLMKRTIRSIWIRRIHSFLTNYMITKSYTNSSKTLSMHPSEGSTTSFTPSYSVFISKLKQSKILLNRKILSQLSIFDGHSMQKIIQSIE
jgi:large subunit ribosomal protein L20